MKLLPDILENVTIVETHGNLDVSVANVSLSSNDIVEHSLFTAIVGNITDGHIFINDVIKKGAKVIVYQSDITDFENGITYVRVPDTKTALGVMAGNFYDNPSFKLRLVGITGTNGKTTTATLLHQLFLGLGQKAGMIGTVANKINNDSFEAVRTTPDQVSLNKLLAEMVDAGCDYCFMEASSHAVSEKRIAGLHFVGGIFTNLTQDHLDYHKTMEDYRDAKKSFFDALSENAFALSNLDDPNGKYMLSGTYANKYFYSLKEDADFNEQLETKLLGRFNAYNALAVYATAVLLDEDRGKIKNVLKTLEPVEGRFNYIKSDSGIIGIVDYAHTPDALENVLNTIQEMNAIGNIITVIGCGGDRDKTKRPIMASIGYNMSDILILTSDNPRSEKAEDILADMKSGIIPDDSKEMLIIPERKEAIKKAVLMAHAGDYILIAGKGHEKYQEVNGVKTHFDDMEELKKFLDF